MDIALQIYQPTAAEPKSLKNSKTHAATNKKDFSDILERIKSHAQKATENETKDKDVDELLMQLLNLLNIDISLQDFEAFLPEKLQNLFSGLDSINFEVKTPADELNKCWQAIIAEFKVTGYVKEDTVEKFSLALKKALSAETDVDLDSLKNAINEVLKTDQAKSQNTIRPETTSNNRPEEQSALIFEANGQNSSENTKTDNNVHQFKQKAKNDVEALKIKETIKEVADTGGAISEEHGYNQLAESNSFQQNNIMPSTTTLVAPKDNPGSMMITAPENPYDAQNIFGQITDKVQFALKGDVQEVRVRLKPDYLGDVLIKVISDKGKLKAELFVANSQVRSMLKAHTIDFQNQIRQQGYNFSEINVYEMTESMDLGAFNQQSGGNSHYHAKRPKAYFYGHQEENLVAATDSFSLWDTTSNVNLMA